MNPAESSILLPGLPWTKNGRCVYRESIDADFCFHRCTPAAPEPHGELTTPPQGEVIPEPVAERCVKCGHLKNDPRRRGSDKYSSFCLKGCGCECTFVTVPLPAQGETLAPCPFCGSTRATPPTTAEAEQ